MCGSCKRLPFGLLQVDVWINNAAYSGAFQPFMEMSHEQVAEVSHGREMHC